ncbi:MAG TPA: LuxR C-terminal-related transcriptional regulator [Solirubrobacteraceae bacterium]|nr:LuxR C-terminal-related transcriptional regulator [Solirubrobacteraceae bacterium]
MSSVRGEPGWQQLFWLVFERSTHPIALLGDDRRIIAVNDAGVALWGGSREELVGLSIFDSIRPAEQAAAVREWEAFLRSGEYSGTRDLLRADGSAVEVEFAARWAVVAGRRLAVYVATATGESARRPRLASELPLTTREREVVTLIALGRDTNEIAAELHISPETVRSHVRNAMSKLDVHTRAQLVAVAICGNQTMHEAVAREGTKNAS